MQSKEAGPWFADGCDNEWLIYLNIASDDASSASHDSNLEGHWKPIAANSMHVLVKLYSLKINAMKIFKKKIK